MKIANYKTSKQSEPSLILRYSRWKWSLISVFPFFLLWITVIYAKHGQLLVRYVIISIPMLLFLICILPALMPKPAAVINFRGIIYYPMGITPVFIDWEEVSHIQLYDLNTILLLGIGSKDFKSVLARARWYDRLSLQLAANSYPLPLSIPINYLSLSKKEVLKQLEKYYQYKILYQS